MDMLHALMWAEVKALNIQWCESVNHGERTWWAIGSTNIYEKKKTLVEPDIISKHDVLQKTWFL